MPDYVAKTGGLIQAAGELEGPAADLAYKKAEAIHDTVITIFARSAAEAVTPDRVADLITRLRPQSSATSSTV